MKNLNKYLAKSNNQTISQHNSDLRNILNQLQTIHSISQQDIRQLKRCIRYHDVGKVISEFQDNIESTHRSVRHELISASCSELSLEEKLIILFHHKNIDYVRKFVGDGADLYDDFLNEVSEKLNCEMIEIKSLLNDLIRNNRKYKNTLYNNLDLILKLGYMKLCDHMGSAGVKHIDRGFNAREVYNFDTYRSIQNKVLEMKRGEDTIVIAPTGCGKTETSLLWSDKVQNKDNSKRIFYVLPYTASINALYVRLKSSRASTGLLHGKVRSLLMRDNEVEDEKLELQLIRNGVRQVTICTIWQIIKAVFKCKNNEMQLAQFNNSIFIIDEIHCFDVRTLAFMLESLKWMKDNLNIKICIMSASIPTVLLNKIREVLEIENVIYADSSDYLTRHQIIYSEKTIYDDMNLIESYIENDKQVLLCVNNIATSQELYSQFKSKYPDKNIKLLHGKFNAADRAIIEKDLKNCDILIGTQAIEVSLDIDYDVLFTEVAPYDSLLQRFGRVNRKGKKAYNNNVYIYNPVKENKIYPDVIIDRTITQLKEIMRVGGIVDEGETTKRLDNVYIGFEEEEYDENKAAIEVLLNGIRFAEYSKTVSDDMINRSAFQETVLPLALVGKYDDCIRESKYIEAGELLVNTYCYPNKMNVDWYRCMDRGVCISMCVYDDRGLTNEIDNFL